MKKSQVKTVKEKTEGDIAVENSDARGRDVMTSDSVDKSLKTPKWLKPENISPFIEMAKLIVQCEFNNISAFARKHRVSRETIYTWLRHQDTKDLIDEMIKALSTVDKPKIYKMILAKVPDNPGYARLWMERYEGYQPDQPKSGNVTINFNFLDPPKKPVKVAEDADYTEE